MRDFHHNGRSPVYSVNGMAATSMPIASLTAIEVLRAGGNAVDAAIAACAALAVVEPQSTGLGGDCFCLYAPAGANKVIAVNGSGRSGAAASLDAIGAAAAPPDNVSPHTVTIPGAVSGWRLLLDAYGTKGFDELLQARHPLCGGGRSGAFRAWPGTGRCRKTSCAAPGTRSSCPAGARPAKATFSSRRRSRTRCAPSPSAARTPSTQDRSQPTWPRPFGRAAACRRKRISPTDLKAPNLSSRSRFDGAGSTSGSARRTGRVWSR